MSVYHYSIGVCFRDKQITSMPIYVLISDDAMDDDSFIDEVNYKGPSAELEQIICDKLNCLANQMSKAIGVSDGTFNDLLEYSFPIELVSSDPVDKAHDYVYVE